jgi:hypothetical protein
MEHGCLLSSMDGYRFADAMSEIFNWKKFSGISANNITADSVHFNKLIVDEVKSGDVTHENVSSDTGTFKQLSVTNNLSANSGTILTLNSTNLTNTNTITTNNLTVNNNIKTKNLTVTNNVNVGNQLSAQTGVFNTISTTNFAANEANI